MPKQCRACDHATPALTCGSEWRCTERFECANYRGAREPPLLVDDLALEQLPNKGPYREAVIAFFRYLYQTPFNDVLAMTIERVRQAGYTVNDCAVVLHETLEIMAREAEKEGEGPNDEA